MFTSEYQIWLNNWLNHLFYFLAKIKFFLHTFLGMAMTEKQGGSDVRANTTKAYCDNAEEKRYILVGHK
jgi:alkylation response protein AidB-like acyl-CoA dehydrogenase